MYTISCQINKPMFPVSVIDNGETKLLSFSVIVRDTRIIIYKDAQQPKYGNATQIWLCNPNMAMQLFFFITSTYVHDIIASILIKKNNLVEGLDIMKRYYLATLLCLSQARIVFLTSYVVLSNNLKICLISFLASQCLR